MVTFLDLITRRNKKMKKSEVCKSRIIFLEENNGELEVEIELKCGKEKTIYKGFLSEIPINYDLSY